MSDEGNAVRTIGDEVKELISKKPFLVKAEGTPNFLVVVEVEEKEDAVYLKANQT